MTTLDADILNTLEEILIEGDLPKATHPYIAKLLLGYDFDSVARDMRFDGDIYAAEYTTLLILCRPNKYVAISDVSIRAYIYYFSKTLQIIKKHLPNHRLSQFVNESE